MRAEGAWDLDTPLVQPVREGTRKGARETKGVAKPKYEPEMHSTRPGVEVILLDPTDGYGGSGVGAGVEAGAGEGSSSSSSSPRPSQPPAARVVHRFQNVATAASMLTIYTNDITVGSISFNPV